MGLETAAIIGLATAAASGTAGVVGAKLSSNASRDATKAQTDAANKAAEIQAQSAREALAFQQAQAAEDARRFETTQRSNYDQWAARQGYQSTLGSMLGLPSRSIPAYQSSMPGGAPSGAASSGGPLPNINFSAPPDQLQKNLTAFFTAKGVPASEVPYWVTKAPELVARGQEINDPLYANKRLAAADILGGGAGAPSAAAPTRNYSPAYIGPASSLIPPQQTYTSRTLTPALRLPGGY